MMAVSNQASALSHRGAAIRKRREFDPELGPKGLDQLTADP